MKSITLGKIADNSLFIISEKTKQRYRVIKREKDGIVYTSLNSGLSYKRPAKMKVFIP
jgi:hypothetical protein